MEPQKYILTTDYATLKGDSAVIPGTITIPGSLSIAGSSSYETHVDIVIGTKGAVSEARIASSKNANKYIATNSTYYHRNGLNGGFSAPYDVNVFIWRINDTTIRCQAVVRNPYGTTLTGETTAETITFEVDTFLPPFS